MVPEIIDRARRLSLLAEFIATFPDNGARFHLVKLLLNGGIITEHSADLLIENFGLASA